jgi:hypothetical protein
VTTWRRIGGPVAQANGPLRRAPEGLQKDAKKGRGCHVAIIESEGRQPA